MGSPDGYVDDTVDWDALKDTSAFAEHCPVKQQTPPEPKLKVLPREPNARDGKYLPRLGFLDKLISSRRSRLTNESAELFRCDHEEWKAEIAEITRDHSAALARHRQQLARLDELFQGQMQAWAARKSAYETSQAAAWAAVDAKRSAYEASDPEAIREYNDLVLASSVYPEYFPKEFQLAYDGLAKTLIVDYMLPAPDDLPRLRAVKYVASRDDFEEQFITDAQAAKQFDDVLYQVILRTAHELFEADQIGALDSIAINGIVTAVNRNTGNPVTSCLLSLRVARNEFLDINLAHVDPKACFKSLKGVGSSKLHGLTPVAPIMQLPREDARFIPAREVVDGLDDSVNLAVIDWADFEHLIREVFEQEFSASGGEVKVTQASRDGGVDAVAFDPDPIRGGKIVIQAKRYTNTVGVGAVRDLYGTVLNEGATKGILVTTSDYGPDSYAFANGKPLVLLNGANLLHMLEKHGHKARIDLQEAKKLARM